MMTPDMLRLTLVGLVAAPTIRANSASFSIFRFASVAGAFTLAFLSIVRMNVKTLLQFSRSTLKKHLAFPSEAGGVPPLRGT